MDLKYTNDTVDSFVSEHSCDVGASGVFVRSSAPPVVGTLARFYFKIADGSTALTGVGRIVWTSRGDQAELPAGFGMDFIRLDDESTSNLNLMLKSQKPNGACSLYERGRRLQRDDLAN